MWSAVLILILSIVGACSFIKRFTRVAGELFGLLIAVLFLQQAVKVHFKTTSFVLRKRQISLLMLHTFSL